MIAFGSYSAGQDYEYPRVSSSAYYLPIHDGFLLTSSVLFSLVYHWTTSNSSPIHRSCDFSQYRENVCCIQTRCSNVAIIGIRTFELFLLLSCSSDLYCCYFSFAVIRCCKVTAKSEAVLS